jgi:phenylacetate-CoA ligase
MGLDQDQRQQARRLPRESLRALQLEKLNRLLDAVLPVNRFYAQKFAGLPPRLDHWEQLAEFPLTTKAELIGDGESMFARHLTYAPDRYTRFHRTSGTHGRPLAILDTSEDWIWWTSTWQYVLDAVGIEPRDRVAMAFSFGPFVGFWSAHDAVIARGALAVPTGGMSSAARLELILSLGCTIVFCTPTYALRLAEVARDQGLDLRTGNVRTLVVAGEPGGSIRSVRAQIESAWGATVFDHCGATEVGPWGFADGEHRGIIVNEAEFIAEFLPVDRAESTDAAPPVELVLTTLGRIGAPMIRYRTGDLVRPVLRDDPACRWLLLDGGVLGRVDDMITVRGVNIYPGSIEQIVREFSGVEEFRIVVRKSGALDQLAVEIEDRGAESAMIAERLHVRLGLKVDVRAVPRGSLPRSEFKSRRIVDLRDEPSRSP